MDDHVALHSFCCFLHHAQRKQVEAYVRRVGYTGRFGRDGMVTTIVDGSPDRFTLFDIVAVIQEASQKLDPMWNIFKTENPIPCEFCLGMGHTLSQCIRLAAYKKKTQNILKRKKFEEVDKF